MATLLMRLAGPLQSWGTDSRFEVRRTGREPSKSGVIGMVASALGYTREETDKIQALSNKLHLGIRVDQEGKMLRDFHMVKSQKESWVTNRYYLSDAVFVVGLESEDEDLLFEIDHALSHPVFPLYLGRKSCPPAGRLRLGITDLSLENALKRTEKTTPGREELRFIFDSKDPDGINLVRDVPVSFDRKYRKYGYRNVTEKIISVGSDPVEHDPMAELS